MLHVCRPICKLFFFKFEDRPVNHIYLNNLWYISWIIMIHDLWSSKLEIQQSPPFWWWQLLVMISELNSQITILYKKLYQNFIHSIWQQIITFTTNIKQTSNNHHYYAWCMKNNQLLHDFLHDYMLVLPLWHKQKKLFWDKSGRRLLREQRRMLQCIFQLYNNCFNS